MLTSPKVYFPEFLVIARVCIALFPKFAHYLMQSLSRLHCEIVSGQIYESK
jgi:hypothetical protein